MQESDINQHRETFKEEAADLLAELESALLELEEDPRNQDLVNRVFRAMHTLKGSGAMFGFEDIAGFTHEVETVFDTVRCGALPVTRELLDLTLAARDHVSQLLRHADGDVSPFAASGETILQGFRALTPKAQPEPAADQQHATAQAASQGMLTYRVRFKPSPDIYATGNDPAFLLDDLRLLGSCRVFAHFDQLPSLADLDPQRCGLWWDVILSTDAGENAIRDVFIFVEDETSIDIRCISEGDMAEGKRLGEILLERGDIQPDALNQALSSQKPLGTILTETGLVGPAAVESALAEQRAARESRATREAQESGATLRVSAAKLDLLLDLIGELVILQSQIKQNTAKVDNPVLQGLSEQLERLSDEFRDSTLSLRMQPIGSMFTKFRRLVRDLAAQTGKEVELVTRGEETELDKMVIDRLGEALVHLLRNSVDHGLESPERRDAAGKPRKGTLHLRAEHTGGDVVITVQDDGGGIDLKRVRAKAESKGLVAPETRLTDKETMELIFQPGFSTAETISSVSGRGVGMDVVKRVIDSLHGSVQLDSVFGQGTQVTIRMPLTLAIIAGLQVQVAEERYVLPLDCVEECVELSRKDDDIPNKRIINLRGEAVPYISMRNWFALDGRPPDVEHIVIVGVEGERVGILVDHVIGEHQTVIKSLGPMFHDVEGFSGATVQGDGTMSLILDVKNLVAQAMDETGHPSEAL